MAESTKTASNMKDYERTNKLAKTTYMYNQKHAKSAEASVQCIFFRPIACEERNSLGPSVTYLVASTTRQ
jgi:hypothetical protein